MDIKFDTDKERETIKFLWEECIPNEFVQFIYKHNNYSQISQPSLTYQKANTIAKEYLFEDQNRINHLKYKIEEKFDLIIIFIRCCLVKFTRKQIALELQRKTTLNFIFKHRNEKRIKIF